MAPAASNGGQEFLSLQPQSAKGISNQLKGLLFLVLVVVLAVASWFMYQAKPYQYGLDVQGGVRLTLEMSFDKVAM